MSEHLRESRGGEKAVLNTCLSRRCAFSEPPTHLREIPSSPLSNSANCPNTRVVSPPPCVGSTTNDSGLCLLQAIREFVAAWEQHNRFIPRSESPEEWAARKAARDALVRLEDCAQWLEAEMER